VYKPRRANDAFVPFRAKMPAEMECNFYWDVCREIRGHLSGDEIIGEPGEIF